MIFEQGTKGKTIGVLVLALGVGGCASMGPTYRVSDDFLDMSATVVALTTVCVERGHWPRQELNTLVAARNRMAQEVTADWEWQLSESKLRIATFHKEMETNSLESCSEAHFRLPQFIGMMNNHADKAMAHKASVYRAAGMTAATVPAYVPTPVPQAGSPSYQVPRSNTTQVLVDGKTVACTTTSSGVVVCQ
jgi:hypothetical protein